eukprot:GILI01011413.1.p1 GENE.GILI01011413.1~~GILI01011413.1.p1  ORF type:complete len:473 (+),score=106.05 GILI01011413.1:113-1531(+)
MSLFSTPLDASQFLELEKSLVSAAHGAKVELHDGLATVSRTEVVVHKSNIEMLLVQMLVAWNLQRTDFRNPGVLTGAQGAFVTSSDPKHIDIPDATWMTVDRRAKWKHATAHSYLDPAEYVFPELIIEVDDYTKGPDTEHFKPVNRKVCRFFHGQDPTEVALLLDVKNRRTWVYTRKNDDCSQKNEKEADNCSCMRKEFVPWTNSELDLFATTGKHLFKGLVIYQDLLFRMTEVDAAEASLSEEEQQERRRALLTSLMQELREKLGIQDAEKAEQEVRKVLEEVQEAREENRKLRLRVKELEETLKEEKKSKEKLKEKFSTCVRSWFREDIEKARKEIENARKEMKNARKEMKETEAEMEGARVELEKAQQMMPENPERVEVALKLKELAQKAIQRAKGKMELAKKLIELALEDLKQTQERVKQAQTVDKDGQELLKTKKRKRVDSDVEESKEEEEVEEEEEESSKPWAWKT